jgi:type VI secretion system secreted protein Hcp
MAFDVFLKIGTIPGESTDSKHADWIEISSFSNGVSQSSSGSRSDAGAASGGRADFADFTLTKNVDKASPKLMLSCAKGEHIALITIELCRATGDKTKYLEYKLSDVIVSSVSVGGSAAGDLPTENVSLNFGKIETTYFATDHKTGAAKGQVAANWDLTTNKGG